MDFIKLVRKVSGILIMSTIFSCANVSPVSAVETFPSPGLQDYSIEDSMLTAASNAAAVGKKIDFSTNGEATFDILLPFESDCLSVNYEKITNSVVLTLETDGGSCYTGTLLPEETSCDIPIKEYYGSKILKISVNADVTLTSITFNKINEKFVKQGLTDTEYTDYQYELLSAIVVKDNASAMKSRGAIRWLDIEDRYLTPLEIEGSLYVPLKTFANELSLYCEDYPDKNYVLLRGEKLDCVLFGGKGYIESDSDGRKDVEINIVYSEGRTWVPVRKLAESLGYYVAYRDGYAVVDDRHTANNIINDETIFNELKNEMSEFIVPELKYEGKTYHVAQTANASDANSGTEDMPFLTLNKAGEVAKAGDTVIVHEGVYREEFTPKNDGRALAPITYKAAEGEKPVISALEEFKGFIEDEKTGMWIGQLSKALNFGRNQIFYNGEALEAGRHPNTHTHPKYTGAMDDFASVWPTVGNICIKVDKGDVATSDTDLDQPDNYWKGGTFITCKGENWTMVSGDIVSSSKGQIVVKDHDNSRSYNLGLKPSAAHNGSYFFESANADEDWGYITNHIHTVDMPGEWFVDEEGLIYLMPPEGATINEGFEYKVRQRVANLNNRKHIILDGINTIGGGITLHGEETEGCVLNNGSFKYLGHTNRYNDPQLGYIDTDISVYGDDGVSTPERYEDGPREKGELGIYISGYNNSVVNSDIAYCAGAGINVCGSYGYIYNNNVYNCAYMPGYLASVSVGAVPGTSKVASRGGNMIIYNDIRYSGRSNMIYLTAYDSEDSISGMNTAYMPDEVAYNYMAHYGIGTSDTGAFYTFGGSFGNDKLRTGVHHNIFDKPFALDYRMLLSSVYNDNMSTAMDVYQNLSLYEDKNFMSSKYNIGRYYEQSIVGDPASTRMRNNRLLAWIPGGVESLNISDYPDGKAFYAGSFLNDSERFMLNYNKLSTGADGNYKPLTITKAEDGSSIYRFENVNVPSSEASYMTVYCTAEPNYEAASFIKISFFDADGVKIADSSAVITTLTHEWWEYDVSERAVDLPRIPEGTYTVELSNPDEKLTIHRIRVDKQNYVVPDFSINDVIEPGTWDECITNCKESHLPLGRSSQIEDNLYTTDGFKTTLWNTWDYTAVYKDREINEVLNGFEIVYTTGGKWAGSELEIYVDSLDSEPIGTMTASAHPETPDAWEKQTKSVEFTQPVQPGTHTFYFKFDGCGKCTTIYGITFIKDNSGVAEEGN